MNDKISVIVPVYNSEKYVDRCLNSICRQTYNDIEILVVDDGSTDRSGAICDGFAAKDTRIKVWHTANAGVAAARNYALGKISGGYIMFVDSDDWIDATMCGDMVSILKQEGADMLITSGRDWYMKNGEIFPKKSEASNGTTENVVKRIDLEKEFSFLEPYAAGVVWGILYRKECVGSLRFDTDLKVGEDTYFFAQCIRKSTAVYCLNKVYYNYVFYISSAAHGEITESKMTCLTAWERVAELFCDAPRIRDTAKGAYGRQCVYYIMGMNQHSVYYAVCRKKIRQNILFMLMTPSFKEKVDYVGYCISPTAWKVIRSYVKHFMQNIKKL